MCEKNKIWNANISYNLQLFIRDLETQTTETDICNWRTFAECPSAIRCLHMLQMCTVPKIKEVVLFLTSTHETLNYRPLFQRSGMYLPLKTSQQRDSFGRMT